jgi:hypothetical protein
MYSFLTEAIDNLFKHISQKRIMPIELLALLVRILLIIPF